MKKLSVFLICTFLIFVSAGQSFAAPLSQTDTALQIMDLINAYRAENGLPPYACSSTLIGTAQAHSDYQASINERTHTGSGGTTSSQRARAAGYGGGINIKADEIIYSGQFATPEIAVDWWKDSPIHNAIMLNPDYHELGVGAGTSPTHTYYTVNVGSITGVTSPSPMGTPLQCDPVTAPPSGDTTSPGDTALPPDTTTPPDATTPGDTPPDDSGATGDETPTTILEPVSDLLEPLADLQTNQILMIGAGVFILALVGLLLIRQNRKRAELEDEIEEIEADEELEEISERGDAEVPSITFNQLSLDDQWYALEALAVKVLPEYPLKIVSVEPLRYALNAEFLVTALAPGVTGAPKQYVLRVNAPGFHSEAEIRSELQWLMALNRATDLIVPNPIPTKSGEWVTSAEPPGMPEPRYCVLFEHIPGQAVEEMVTEEQMEKVGAFIAKIHHHGAHFSPPEGFTRKHWNQEGLSGGMLDVPVEEVHALLTDEQRAVIKNAEAMLAEAIDRLGKGPDVYGLIHADLHKNSYLFQDNKAYVIDFDTCGYGYYMYDLSVPIWNLIDIKHSGIEALKSALFRGYRQVKTLSLKEEASLKNFIAARLMIHTLTLVAHREDPAIKENAPEAIARQFALLKRLSGIG